MGAGNGAEPLVYVLTLDSFVLKFTNTIQITAIFMMPRLYYAKAGGTSAPAMSFFPCPLRRVICVL